MQDRSAQGRMTHPAFGRARLLLFWLALLPFLGLSLLAQGTMLERGVDDRLTVVLCLPEGAVEVMIGPDGNPVPVDKASHGGDVDICDWAIHGQPMLDALLPPLAGHVPVELRLTLLPPAPDHARRLAVLAPSARGPPTLV